MSTAQTRADGLGAPPDPRGPTARGRRSSGRAPSDPKPIVGWLFIAPNLLGVLAFTFIPLVSVILLSFTEWNLVSGFGGIDFVGLDNFLAVFQDPTFWRSLVITILYAGVAVPLTLVVGLALALALNRDIPARGLLRAAFFVPYIVNIVAIGMTWQMLLDPSAGLVNQFLGVFGLEHLPQWFASSYWALPALILVTIWSQAGYANLIYLSALQDAPTQLYEAARIDGAGRWASFRAITWPSLLPTTVFLLITLFVGISQTFGMIALITNGGPGASTTTLSFYMYQTSFQFYRFGYASAVGLVTFVGIFAIMLLMWRAQRGRALHD
ncbi:carbohydrate ABC transporter permease [Brachybacterium sacelli]|uniref:ABC-type sugar transport system permease subunit n=1 Tax=Brachybacterium sacelli TaxID=173364 RepID=A0ABS4WXS7_9MICO|nr:sugar ABC transporter permease [Brachybacterium sacelli]MBP2381015.1 ABC-type sugar transport system permease subunit [Brachybacterium sacelli]